MRRVTATTWKPRRRLTGPTFDLFTAVPFVLMMAWLLIAVPAASAPLPLVLGGVGALGVFMLMEQSEGYRREKSLYAAMPVALSVVQNLYLGAMAPSLTTSQLQALLIVNFLIGLLLAAMTMLEPGAARSQIYTLSGTVLVATGLFSIVTIGMFGGEINTALASMRNLLNPALFCFIGAGFAGSILLRRYLKYIAALGIFVATFGLVEEFFYPDFWVANNVDLLWELKGLPISDFTGLPANFYSSETVGGEHLRRMASTFADPVNLGTFLFVAFMACWYVRWRLAAALMVVAIVMTVSKGAALGLLIFAVVRARRTAPELRLVTLLATGAAGVAFIGYSLANSTHSIVAHFNGFANSFKGLPAAPFGHGVGNVGILASVEGNAASEVTESGIGVIVGQLGVIGLALFVVLMWGIYKRVKLLPPREATLGVTLLLAILANIAFNEIALSPNSSAAYFVTLGVLAASAPRARRRPRQPVTRAPVRAAAAFAAPRRLAGRHTQP